MVYLTRKAYFSAAHRYHNPKFSDEENRRVFGKCNFPHGHGHNYVVEVTVRGEPAPDTGMVINLVQLDKVIKIVTEEVDHKHLNMDLPYFADVIPTTENIALFLWKRIEAELKGAAQLHHLRLFEDEGLYVDVTDDARHAAA